MKSIKQLQQEEDERRRVFDAKIKQLKTKETSRVSRAVEKLKLTDYAITDTELIAGLQHAIDLSIEREKANARADGIDTDRQERAEERDDEVAAV